jgi:hypothetical protein
MLILQLPRPDSLAVLHFRQQRGHVVPQLPPRLPLQIGEVGQRRRLADRGEVGVLPPMLQSLPDRLFHAGLVTFCQLGVRH